MEIGKIIVIEGPSNTGKTTTCQNMKKYKDCEIIEECMIYDKNPPKSSTNHEEEINNQNYFFEIERRRMKKATALAKSGKNVILDRCALSTVAVAYAKERMGQCKGFKSALNGYINLFKDEEFIKPDMYYFLHTDFETTRNRNNTRTKSLEGEWIGDSFTAYQNEFYETISSKIPNSTRICTTGKEKDYVSRLIASYLKCQEVDNSEDGR